MPGIGRNPAVFGIKPHDRFFSRTAERTRLIIWNGKIVTIPEPGQDGRRGGVGAGQTVQHKGVAAACAFQRMESESGILQHVDQAAEVFFPFLHFIAGEMFQNMIEIKSETGGDMPEIFIDRRTASVKI